MEQTISIDVTAEGAVRVCGNLDAYSADEFRDRLLNFLQTGPLRTLDLSEVGACDATGIQLLFALRKTADRLECGFRITNVSLAVVQAAEALGLSLE